MWSWSVSKQNIKNCLKIFFSICVFNELLTLHSETKNFLNSCVMPDFAKQKEKKMLCPMLIHVGLRLYCINVRMLPCNVFNWRQ